MSGPGTFAAVAVTLYAAHQVGDYWVQTNDQAARKGRPGWDGRSWCAAHVCTYSVTLSTFLWVAHWWLDIRLMPTWLLAGLGVSAVTHYFADRRKPLEQVCSLIPGKLGFYRDGDGLATGATLLDQAWHWAWLFVSALLISGPPR